VVTSVGGKRKKKPIRRRKPKQPLVEAATWIDEDGLHALLPGTAPEPEMMEELTRRDQEHIRRSLLWDELVREFGLEWPSNCPREFRAELR